MLLTDDTITKQNKKLCLLFLPIEPQVSEIELSFYPRPDRDNSDDETRYIKTTDNATIAHLKKYLAMRMQVDADKSEGKLIM